jgi:hypothetical protein
MSRGIAEIVSRFDVVAIQAHGPTSLRRATMLQAIGAR